VKDLNDKFAEVEKRVKGLATENAELRKRVSGLERQLAAANRGSQELETLHGKKLHIKEKIENILRSLEAAGGEK
jgi:predicted  nucleic acid-binding Zn-ribbon protein